MGYYAQNNSKLKQWASYQIRNIAGCACARNAGNVSRHHRLQRKPLVSDPGMHHGTCLYARAMMHVGIPGACAPTVLRIWQEAHAACTVRSFFSTRGRLTDCWTYLQQVPRRPSFICVELNVGLQGSLQSVKWHLPFMNRKEWGQVSGVRAEDHNSYEPARKDHLSGTLWQRQGRTAWWIFEKKLNFYQQSACRMVLRQSHMHICIFILRGHRESIDHVFT